MNLRNLTLDLISFSDDQFKVMLLAVTKSKSLRTLTLSSVHFDTDFKVEILTGFLGSNKNQMVKITLAENQLTSLDTLLSMMYHNKSLKELHLLNQAYFRSESRMSEGEIKGAPLSKENRTLEKLSMSLGILKTIKPLIRVFNTFTRLKEFSLSNIEFTNKMYFQVIDNYLISNPYLAKLTLSNVKLGYDQFIVLAGTIRNSRRLRSLDLSSNQLRNQGCIEVANMLVSNTGLQSLNLDNNDIREAGLVALLKVLKENRSLVHLRLENNKFLFSRQLLGFLGDVFVYHNRTLRTMIMTSLSKSTPILRREQDEGSEYDRDMISMFI